MKSKSCNAMNPAYSPKRDYKLLIECITYNQAGFITDTLNGFAIQQTDFPFACFVIDDASTDGEQDVIREWLDRECDMTDAEYVELDLANVIIVSHKQNTNCTFAVYLLKRNLWKEPDLKGTLFKPWREIVPYIALCEGDDYWTDPNKIQKQVAFLEGHPDYSLCFHNAIEHWEDGSKEDKQFSIIEDRDYSELDIFKQWLVPTASAVMKREVITSDFYGRLFSGMLKDYQERNMVLPGDTILFVSCAVMGRMHGFSDIASVYRCHKGGATVAMSYWGYIQNYYYFQKYLPEPYKSCARDMFFKGAPHLYVAHFKSRSLRRDILKKSLDIGVFRTIKEHCSYSFKVILEKI